ncbi:MAG: DUF1351 domain-containing protein [Candidatus Limivicinus sp.]
MEDERNALVPILECRQPAVVEDNLVDLQQRVMTVIDTIDNLPRTRESLPEARKARAELNKYYSSLETQRKLVKAAVMLPYDKAMERYKGLVQKPILEADEKCRSFIDGVENDVKMACEGELRGYFTELCQSKGIYWLPFERVGIKVTLAMADQKELRKPKERIREFVQKVETDLTAITGMDGSAEILVEYEQTLDVASAIARVNSRKRAKAIMEENNAKYQAAQSTDSQTAQHIAANAPEAVQVLYASQEKKYRVTFTITATMPMLRGLKAFLEGHNYQYKEVTNDGKQ